MAWSYFPGASLCPSLRIEDDLLQGECKLRLKRLLLVLALAGKACTPVTSNFLRGFPRWGFGAGRGLISRSYDEGSCCGLGYLDGQGTGNGIEGKT